jgi:hypothetical protein
MLRGLSGRKFLWGNMVFLLGVFAKTWCKWWLFDGEVVVKCVVKLVN